MERLAIIKLPKLRTAYSYSQPFHLDVMKTHLHYFIMFYFHMEGIALIDVIRRQDGDVEKILSCKGGTVVARHDETHTLFCANNLKEAGRNEHGRF